MDEGDDDLPDEFTPDEFTRAWARAGELAGERYFTHGLSSWTYRHMAPDVQAIKKDLECLPASQAILLAVMVSFYNGDTGAKMLRGLQVGGLGDIAIHLGGEQRHAVCDLLLSFNRW